MEHSIEFRRELKKLNVDAALLACADLIALGYKDIDAYMLLFPEELKLNLPEKQQRVIIDKKFGSAKFKKLLADRISRVKESAIPVELDEVELIDGDEVAKEILRSAKAAPVGSRERADLFVKYSELQQRNTVEPEQEDTDAINFYFPIKCSQCPLFAKFNDVLHEDVGERVRPDEMVSLISKAVEKAYPDAKEAYEALHGSNYDKDMKLSNEAFEREMRQLRAKYGIEE